MTEQIKKYSKSGRVCAVLSQDGRHWVLPLYKHPVHGQYSTPQELEEAHLARCIPSGAVDLLADVLERIERAAFGGGV